MCECACLQPGVVEGFVDGDPLGRVQHQHAPHQVLGALRDVGPLAGVHLGEYMDSTDVFIGPIFTFFVKTNDTICKFATKAGFSI